MIKIETTVKDKIWGIEPQYGLARIVPIYETLKKLPLAEDFRLIDIACGYGLIADAIKGLFPQARVEQIDIRSYPEWKKLNVKPQKKTVQKLVEENEHYDVVMFLNSYRNWDGIDKDNFDEWLKGHCRYFIYSGDGGEVIGMDSKDHQLKLLKI